MTRAPLVLLALVFCWRVGAASEEHGLASYVPGQPVTGTIRVWTNVATDPLLRRWQEGFSKTHPHATFEANARGSDVAMAALTTSRADIALLGRTPEAQELKAFEWIFRYKPEPIEVANGSDNRPGHSPPLIAYVHTNNPLSRISLTQLDAAFGLERLRGAPRSMRMWSDLGVQGKWSRQPVNLYAIDTESGTGRYFREQVLGGSRKLDWERLREFTDSGSLAEPRHDESEQILRALAADPYGLAVAARSGAPPPAVKELALSRDGEFVTVGRGELIARRYPLTRPIYAYVNRNPGAPLDSRVAEFLRYVLSREGQQAILDGGDFLPLSAADARRQAAKLR